jgi:hypothetical protein
VKSYINKFISIGLSLLFFCAIFHLDYHADHEHPSGYNICNVGCDDIEHHSCTHQCEKCLSETQRYVGINLFEFSFHNFSTPFDNPEDIIFFKLINFNSNNKGPPNIL